MTIQRIVLEFRDGELVARVLYRSGLDGPNPSTKARARVVTDLAKAGLRDALEALEGRLDVVGEAGFLTREDTLLATASPSSVTTPKTATPVKQ